MTRPCCVSNGYFIAIFCALSSRFISLENRDDYSEFGRDSAKNEDCLSASVKMSAKRMIIWQFGKDLENSETSEVDLISLRDLI